MAHYSNIDESRLISAINTCKIKINKQATKDLLADAQSLVWEGTSAKENLVNTLNKINTKTIELEEELNKCLKIAQKIKKYKELYKTIKNLKKQKTNLEWQKTNSTNTNYYLEYAINEKRRMINSKKDELDSIKKSLSSDGYPPV